MSDPTKLEETYITDAGFGRITWTPSTTVDSLSFVKALEFRMISEVDIRGCVHRNRYTERDDEGTDETGLPVHTWLDALVNGLPALLEDHRFNIEKLTLDDLVWGRIAPPTQTSLLFHLHDITELVLSKMSFENANQLLTILGSFPRLSTLEMDKCSGLLAESDVLQIARAVPLNLRHLRLDSPDSSYGPVVQWLADGGVSVTIKKAFLVWEEVDIPALLNFFRTIAPSLETLTYMQRAPNKHHIDDEPIQMNLLDDGNGPTKVDVAAAHELKRRTRECEAAAEANSLLDSHPIQACATAHLHVRITWSRLAPIAIKLLCQLSSQAECVSLLLDFSHSTPDDAEWGLVGEMLHALATRLIAGNRCALRLRMYPAVFEKLPRVAAERTGWDFSLTHDEWDYDPHRSNSMSA